MGPQGWRVTGESNGEPVNPLPFLTLPRLAPRQPARLRREIHTSGERGQANARENTFALYTRITSCTSPRMNDDLTPKVAPAANCAKQDALFDSTWRGSLPRPPREFPPPNPRSTRLPPAIVSTFLPACCQFPQDKQKSNGSDGVKIQPVDRRRDLPL